MPTRGPRPKTWLVFGTCCSSPSRTSASSLMSSTTSSPMTGIPRHPLLPGRPPSGRYFPPMQPSALAGVGKPPKPASLLPPPPPFLPLFFYPCPCVGCTLTGPPCPTQRGSRGPSRHAWGSNPLKEGSCVWRRKALLWACMGHFLDGGLFACCNGAWLRCTGSSFFLPVGVRVGVFFRDGGGGAASALCCV